MKITFLVHDAYSADNTAVTTAALASAPAKRHKVEIVSYFRITALPQLPMPGVTLSPLTDLRPLSRDDPLRTVPSPPNVLGDTRLFAYLRDTDADVVIATSPNLVRFLAAHARPGYLYIGQDHLLRGLHKHGTLSLNTSDLTSIFREV
ncbi:hypothetical protein PYK79_06425 [Streptomyces sp. ID05-04B]|uniref:hypothetical protein n=1 Tax=unclassified Streptomyces TaxID=2593676 RepID=UPI000D19AEAC|nr:MULTISPECIES: hypothetical protein [unclassified Streptomyces]AVV44801.1 hypothetical protein C6376_28780 [Streptomyces sp. P3]MDX5563126.1 hypothetical protein [Streptomyces sp. ID05-04B]